jgi:hypothetical protein
MVLANLFLAKGRHRYLTIAVGNILLFTLLADLLGGGLKSLFVFNEPAALCGFAFFFWLGFRAFFLTRRKNIDVYLHFDLSVGIIFLIIVFGGMAQALLPDSLAWFLASFLFNAAALSLIQDEKEAGSRPAWPGIILVSLVLIPFSLLLDSLSPYLYAPARFFYDLGRPVVSLLGRIFVFFVRLLYGPRSLREDSVSQLVLTAPLGGSPGTTAVSPWFDILAKAFFWLAVFVLAATAVSLTLYLLGRLVVWLLGRQAVEESAARNPTLRGGLRRLMLALRERLRAMIVPWFPGKIDVPTAYRVLLRWGIHKRCPRRTCETPFEYLNRLKKRFPGYQEELREITGYYVEFKYGRGADHVAPDARYLKQRLRRLYFPRLRVPPAKS